MLRLKKLREQERLSQESLALKLNVSQSTISAYETGERTPDLETFIKIADLFNVSLDYLCGKSNTKQSIQSSDLSPEELDHVYVYRQLTSRDKEKVKADIDGLKS